jgi:nucleoside-diphosphate-sugar epimerase
MPAPKKQKRPRKLTVAVTGPTGTFGSGLIPLLQADDRVERIVGIARRPFDPAARGWSKMEYRQGDVRDEAALEEAFADADVVVHLAFLITGTADRATTRAINVDGTLNVFRAAAAAGAQRFVYASSVAAYGFHPDNPVPMDEGWPTRPAAHLFYAQEKAELEHLLHDEAAGHPELALYLLRPPFVLGPNAVGGKEILPGPLAPLGRLIAERLLGRLPVRLPAPAPDLPLQLIHEDDVGSAFLLCVLGAGPPGAYNIAADEVLSAVDVVRELGLQPVPFPARLTQAAARAIAALPTPPFVPPAAEWIEAISHPAIMDTSKAKADLGWTPQFSALEALRATLEEQPAAEQPA